MELLVAITISLVVMGTVFFTFKSQQDSYVEQDQVSEMQQNVRSAMYLITRDLQMAGYYTNFDPLTYTMDWDNLGTNESVRPLIYAHNDLAVSGDGVKDNTDLIVIVKASAKGRQLTAAEGATGSTVDPSLRDVDNLTAGKCALLVKEDLTRAEFFQVQENSGDMSLTYALSETYEENDWIFRADVIIYFVNDDGELRRNNLGTQEGAQLIVENIRDLQFQYLLNTGPPLVDDPTGNEADVRAVEVSITGETRDEDEARRKTRTLCSRVKTRNIGL